MSGEADNRSDAEGATPKTALVFLIFLIAGPPVGILFLWVLTMVLAYSLGDFSIRALPAHLRSFGVFAAAAYVLGGMQALFVGCVAAVVQSMSHAGLVPVRPVLVACLLASVPYPAFMIVTTRSPPPWDMLLAMVRLHVGSGLLCWLICNAILWPFRRRSANQVMA